MLEVRNKHLPVKYSEINCMTGANHQRCFIMAALDTISADKSSVSVCSARCGARGVVIIGPNSRYACKMTLWLTVPSNLYVYKTRHCFRFGKIYAIRTRVLWKTFPIKFVVEKGRERLSDNRALIWWCARTAAEIKAEENRQIIQSISSKVYNFCACSCSAPNATTS